MTSLAYRAAENLPYKTIKCEIPISNSFLHVNNIFHKKINRKQS